MSQSVVRTSAGLRDALFDALDQLRQGQTNPATVNAVAKVAGQICETVNMELEVHKYLSRFPEMAPDTGHALPNPLKLGN